MMHSTTPSVVWSLVVLVLWVVAVGGAAWAVVHIVRRPQPRHVSPPSPLDILERRFAAGEVTREDFDEARARLREHELDV